ncbi:MAG: TIGR01777 family oxidoreductase [Chloroflexi bacterium]|nr:TIGR01777 family oxidoreductase [Chloroflexota bacterium]
MRVVVAGGGGFIGEQLCVELAQAGHQVDILSRHPERLAGRLPNGVRARAWRPPRLDPGWEIAVAEADAVVNLAGASLADGRWTAQRKVLLRDSRVDSTRALVMALGNGGGPQRVLVNASAVGYYGDRGEEELTEVSAPGEGFLARICVDWEAAAREAEQLGVRVVLARLGVVLGEGGALPRLILPYRLFVGGRLGSGRQWMSLVHRSDVVGVIRHALEDDAVSGPLNAVMPLPIRNADLARLIGAVLHRPSALPAPAAALRLALGREMADEMLLASQRVLPAETLAGGYHFRYPKAEGALRDALRA